MKKNILKIFATGLSIAFVASCDLNLSPNNAIAVVEGTPLVQTKTNLSALENGILSAYRSIQNGDFVLPQEFMVDGFNATIDFGNNYGGIHKTDQNFTSADYYVEDFWAYNYFAIKNFNVCIENLQVVLDKAHDVGTMTDAKVEVDDGETVREAVHKREQAG